MLRLTVPWKPRKLVHLKKNPNWDEVWASWFFLSVCPNTSVRYSARPENFQCNYSFLTGEICSVVISDDSHPYATYKCRYVSIGIILIWSMLGSWKEYQGGEKNRGENNLVPLTGYLVSNQLSVTAQDAGRLDAILKERSGCWDLHAKCSPSCGNAVCHSHSTPVPLVTRTDTKAGLSQHVSVPTRDHQKALAIADALNKKEK